MRAIASFFVLALVVVASGADEKKEEKKHEYEAAKLPNVVKVKAGESIVVTYKFPPKDLVDTEIKTESSNGDVKVKGEEAAKGVVEITIRSDKKGTAKVRWRIELANGTVHGPKEPIDVEVE
jgi:hypothetical protein